MELKRIAAGLAIAGLWAGVVASAQAGIVWFSDRTAWTTAVGAASFTEDFSGFGSDTSFRTSPVALSGMSIAEEGTNQNFRNEVDVIPLAFPDNNGTNNASMFTDFGATQVRITFGAINLAFAGESWLAADGEVARMEVYNGASLLGSQNLTNGLGAFLGYLLTGGDNATSVRFVSVNNNVNGGEGFGYDNLAGVNARAVPEPMSVALVGLGLAGLSFSRRKRP